MKHLLILSLSIILFSCSKEITLTNSKWECTKYQEYNNDFFKSCAPKTANESYFNSENDTCVIWNPCSGPLMYRYKFEGGKLYLGFKNAKKGVYYTTFNAIIVGETLTIQQGPLSYEFISK